MDKNDTLETTGIRKPDIRRIETELDQACEDSNIYAGRMSQVRSWWLNEWGDQSVDGRNWGGVDSSGKAIEVFPWMGCSDSRLRIVSTIIQEHVTLSLAAFWSAKKQAKSIRPFVSGRETNVTQKMLDWRVGTQMKRELIRELPTALLWRFGGGLSFIKVEWEQQRELAYVPITLDMIGEISSALGLGDVMDRILDPDKAYDKDLITVLQSLSPVLPTAEARTVLNELRESGQSELPVASLRVNKPKWTARRPIYDILFPSETCDIQQTRFTAERELISESELTDRIVTDGYDPDFVEEALKHKGVFSSWWPVTLWNNNINSNRDLVELTHFMSWRLDNDVPCLYNTIFNQAASSGNEPLYAVHEKFKYDHQQIPLVALRRSYMYRPLLSSIGIAEEAYTDELDIKRQQDGINDHTDIVRKPPAILPTMRAQAMANQYGPGGVMTAMRPESVVYPPLPPWDNTPLLAMEMVQQRLDRRYPITGGAVDPEIKALWRQRITQEVNSELDLALEQTLQLMQQYETDEDIAKVAGGEPWEYSAKDIQGQYTVSTTIDINMIDTERANMKLDNLAKMMPYKESGVIFNMMANIIDPDLADALNADQASPVAMEKEVSDEYSAIGQILAGMEARKPQNAMNQLRLQTIQQILMDPATMQKLQMDEVAQKRIQNRMQYFQDQIQQFQVNPQIGKTLTHPTFTTAKNSPMSMPAQ